MAKPDLQKTIEVLFTANDTGFASTIYGVGQSIESLSGNVGSVTGPIADWTGSLLQAEAALVGMGVALAGVAVTQAGQFRESVVEIGTLFNGTGEQVEQLQKQILEYARGSTASIEDINSAVYMAISTGTDYADAIKYVSDIEVLATAGRESLAATTDVLSGSMNAFGAATSEAADYSDVLMVSVQQGKTSLPELASALSKVTSDAASAKVPFADLNAAIAAITVTGVGTSEAVTKIRALLTELARPSDELKTALNGVTLESDGLDGVMRQLLESTGGTSEGMNRLFGSTEAVSAATILANDSAGKYAAALQAMEDRSGAAATAAEKFANEFSDINQNLVNNIQVTFAQAGLPILDSYGDIVGELSNLFAQVGFSIDEGAFDAVIDSMNAGGERITNLLRGIADALPEALQNVDFTVLLDAFGRLSDEMGGLFGDLDLTKAEDLQKALQALVNAVAALTNWSASAVDGLSPFIRKMAEMIDEVNDGESGLIDFVGQIMGVGTAINAMLPALDLLANGIILLAGAKALGKAVPSMTTFVNVAKSAGTVLPLLANPVTALAAGLVLLAVNFDEVTTIVEEYIAGLLDLETRAERTTKETEALAQMFEKNRKASEDSRDAVGKLAQELWGGKDAQEGMAQATDKATDALDGESGALTEYQKLAAQTEAMQKDFAARTAERAAEQARITEERRKATMALVNELESLTKGEFDRLDAARQQELLDAKRTARQEGWLQALSDEEAQRKALQAQQEKDMALTKEATDLMFRQTQQTLDFALALEEIRSDERMKIIELTFSIELEQLRQGGETARAIIESINTSIVNTGETLASLAGNLTGFSSTTSSGYREMMELVQAEEKRRDAALELQREITTAQIEQMEAQTELLRAKAEAAASGEALIKVEAANLTPALELIFDEVLRHTYLKATEEGEDFLLGLTS